ncbi:MAG: secretion protein HlyD [Halieaceae bacterium]|jgi:HlyD family secretion protein|nr:secretion protein HlyD [Halieaceae bacterium]
MKKPVMVLVLVLLAVGGYLGYQQWSANGSGETLLYGNVDIRDVQLGFRVAGRLVAMEKEEGDAVAAGDLLASLDEQPLREALAVAEANVMEARANLDRANTGSRPQEIQQAEAAVEEAQAALDNADKQLVRQKDLFRQALNSRRELDDAESRQEQAQARLRSAQEALALAREGFRAEDRAAAAAALAAAEARRDQAATQLSDTRLYAPSAGVIQVRAREPGSMVNIGEPVYTLSLTDVVYVRAYVGETQLGQVVPGASVEVLSDSSERIYQGQVGFVSPRAEFTPKTVETPELRTDLVYRLRIVVAEPDDRLRQGMPVTVRLGPSPG